MFVFFSQQLEQTLNSLSKAHSQGSASSSKSPQGSHIIYPQVHIIDWTYIFAGVETLSLYGKHFFEQLSELESECDHARKQDTMTMGTTPIVQD